MLLFVKAGDAGLPSVALFVRRYFFLEHLTNLFHLLPAL
jgi:hypothetical protein